jgi:hypothetical protein
MSYWKQPAHRARRALIDHLVSRGSLILRESLEREFEVSHHIEGLGYMLKVVHDDAKQGFILRRERYLSRLRPETKIWEVSLNGLHWKRFRSLKDASRAILQKTAEELLKL